MREGWNIMRLSDVCDMYQPKTISKKMLVPDGKYPVFGANGVIGKYNEFNHAEPQLLVTCRGATCGSVNISQPYSWINGNAMVVKPKGDNLITNYLKYFFQGGVNFSEVITGSAQPQITRQSLNPLSIPIPSIEEQKEIVSILDDAFASINKAKANIERNIENAKELFQSKLNEIFSQTGERWKEKRFKDVCVLQRGFDLPKRLREKGKYDLVTSSGIKDSHVDYKVEGPGVVTGRSGSIGNVFYIHNNFWPLNTSLYIKDFKENNERYIYYFLKSFDLSRYSSGSGVPTLNRNFVHDELVVSTINIQEQKEIVTILDKLNELTQSSISNYEKELENLEELNKSILQKAFSGELTNKSVAA